jgi:hypothetical protein
VEELPFARPDFLLRKVPVVRMPQKEQETAPEPLKPEEVTELQALLQTDNIAPVDRMTFGMRLAELIIRVRNVGPREGARHTTSGFSRE